MKHNNFILILTAILAAALLVLTGCNRNRDNDEMLRIGILKGIDHPALDAAARGFRNVFAEAGYRHGENVYFDERSAMGDAAIRLQLAQMFVNNNSDMILAIGTGASQSVVAETDTIPIVITAVTDPVAAGLVASLARPGNNVMGMSDLTPVASQIELMRRLIPTAQTVGVIFNSSELNSRIQADLARAKVESLGLIYVEATVTGTADIAQVAESLAGRVDVIYIPTCNTIASAYSLVIQIADEHNVPVIVGESAGVDQGALATEGINYYNLGRRTGEMALMMLRGEAVLGEIPIEFLDRNDVVINTEAAARHGIVIPEDILAAAELRP